MLHCEVSPYLVYNMGIAILYNHTWKKGLSKVVTYVVFICYYPWYVTIGHNDLYYSDIIIAFHDNDGYKYG